MFSVFNFQFQQNKFYPNRPSIKPKTHSYAHLAACCHSYLKFKSQLSVTIWVSHSIDCIVMLYNGQALPACNTSLLFTPFPQKISSTSLSILSPTPLLSTPLKPQSQKTTDYSTPPYFPTCVAAILSLTHQNIKIKPNSFGHVNKWRGSIWVSPKNGIGERSLVIAGPCVDRRSWALCFGWIHFSVMLMLWV